MLMNKPLAYSLWCGLLCFIVTNTLTSQDGNLDFLKCSAVPYRLCEQSEGVRLPDNNQIYLGEENPDASAGSVHVSQSKTVQSDCSVTLTYEVQLIQFENSEPFVLKQATQVTTDMEGIAYLSYDTEEALDELVQRNGIPYTSGCARFHTIKWMVRDTCGNEIVCEERIEIFDCVAPFVETDPEEVFTIKINVGLQYTIRADNFIDSIIDDQTAKSDFLYSLSEDKYLPKATYDCCEPPAYGVVLPYYIWVGDAGTDTNCDGIIEWHERRRFEKEFRVVYLDQSGSCDCFESTILAGALLDKSGNGIAGVTVEQRSEGVYPSYITSFNGRFNFNYYWGAKNISIVPTKNDAHKNGVSILDLIKLQNYVLGKEDLSAYELIAADVDNSERINFFDVFELRKLVLGYYTELPQNTSWRFLPRTFIFSDPLNPWSFPEEITVSSSESHFDIDFIGIKIGDLNGTAQPNFNALVPREALTPLPLSVSDKSFKSGDIVEVPIRIDADLNVMGMQFTLAADGMEIVNVLSGACSVADSDFALFDDKMTFCWVDVNGLEVSARETLFTLQLRAKQGGQLSSTVRITSDITSAEMYLSNEQTFIPALSFSASNIDLRDRPILCAPNPWKNETIISFFLNDPSDVQLEIMDINGVVLTSYSNKCVAGHQSMVVLGEDLSGSGLYFYKITSKEFDSTGRMLLLD